MQPIKFREVEKKLLESGFEHAGWQTDYEIPMIHFKHKTIKAINWEITVHFAHDNVLPQNIIDGEEYGMTNEWLKDCTISAFGSTIDTSISYMSPDVLDTCGSIDENEIYLCNEDLPLYDYVIDIITDPYASINFQETYSANVTIFMNWVKTFIPFLSKFGLTPVPFRTTGNEHAMYSSMAMRFEYTEMRHITFYMDVLTWRKYIHIDFAPGFIKESGVLKYDCSMPDFEKETNEQWDELMKFEEEMKNVRSISSTEIIYKDGTIKELKKA